MTVEARFYVTKASETNGGKTGIIEMSAISRGDQNSHWAQATPCANLSMTINNLPAFEQMREWMRQGKDVRVILEPVVPFIPGDGHAFRQGVSAFPDDYHAAPGTCGDCGVYSKYHPGHEAYDQAEVDKLHAASAQAWGLTQTVKA